MKKLVCAKDVENLHAQGKKIIYIDSTTIITPSAKDAADNLKMTFTEETETTTTSLFEGVDNEKLYKVFKILMERGMLKDLLKPYQSETHESGFKVVRGNTVSMDKLETGQPESKACYQEVVNEGSMHAGFLTIQDSKFDWEIECEEINYVIEGNVTITVGGKSFMAHVGDVLFFPKGTKVVWEATGEVRLFYSTCS